MCEVSSLHARKQAAALHKQSMKQMSTLALATRFLADDHLNILPAATNWCDALTRKYFEKWALKDPADTSRGGCSYAYNTNVAGRSLIGMHPKTVFFFETKSGWNQHGGPEILLAQPRYSNTYLVACFDCSVLTVTKDQIPTLRWVPAYEAKKEE
jgi:hypothetical protein